MTTDLAIEPAAVDSAQPASEAIETDVQATQETEEAPKDKPPELTEAQRIERQMQRRIDKLTARNSERERQIEELRAAQQKLTQSQGEGPKESDFQTHEEFLKAQGKWEAQQELSQAEQTRIKQEQAKLYQEKLSAKQQEFTTREAEFRKTTPDYDAKVQVLNEYVEFADKESVGFQVFRDVLMSAPDLPALSYDLGNNPEFLESLTKMEPAEIAWSLIERAISLKNAPKKTVTPSPKPPKAEAGKGSIEKPLSERTPAEIVKWASQHK